MKERAKFRLPPYVMLMLVSVVMSFAIAEVYSLTKDTIEEAAQAARASARNAVMENAASMTELTLAEGAPVDSCFEALDADGELAGYVSQVTAVGFGGEIEITVGLDAGGTITGVSVGGKDFSETSGLGARTREPAFTEQFRGKSGMLVLKQDIDSVTGASISSGAVVSGVNRAMAYMTALLPEDAVSADSSEPLPLAEEQLELLLPGAENVTWMGGGAGINGWWKADNGYIVRATAFGEGPIAVTMGFDNDGTVTGVIIGDENFMETEGRGDRILEDWYKEQFIGRQGPQTYGEGVDAITGATVTSDAALAAVNACMSFDPGDPGEAEALPAETPVPAGSTEPDGVTEATVPQEEGSAEPVSSPEPDGVTEASVPAEEAPAETTVPAEEPGPDAVTEASVQEEIPAPPVTAGEERRPAGALFVGQTVPGEAVPEPDAVSEASVPAETPVPTPDAVSEASVEEEASVPAMAPAAISYRARRAASAVFLAEAAANAAAPDAVSEASVPAETPVPTPDGVTEASVAVREVEP